MSEPFDPKAFRDKLWREFCDDFDSLRQRWDSRLDGELENIRDALRVLADDVPLKPGDERERPFHVQTGGFDVSADYFRHGRLPFAGLMLTAAADPLWLNYNAQASLWALMTGGGRENPEEVPTGRYRYAILLWRDDAPTFRTVAPRHEGKGG